VDRDGETVVFVIDRFAEADFETFVETAQPVVDSIAWS
jgi:hypothetical protein